MLLQFKYFLGIEISRHWSVVGTIQAIWRHRGEWNGAEAAMGFTFMAIVVVMKHYGKKKRYAALRFSLCIETLLCRPAILHPLVDI